MELVLDANIFFSSLLKSGLTRKLALDTELVLYAPEFIITEFLKYLDELAEKRGVEPNELKALAMELIEVTGLQIIPVSEFKEFVSKAIEICPDEKDSQYFALALKRGCGVWSNDKKLKEQKEIPVYSTQDLKERFG